VCRNLEVEVEVEIEIEVVVVVVVEVVVVVVDQGQEDVEINFDRKGRVLLDLEKSRKSHWGCLDSYSHSLVDLDLCLMLDLSAKMSWALIVGIEIVIDVGVESERRFENCSFLLVTVIPKNVGWIRYFVWINLASLNFQQYNLSSTTQAH
jgi:hypothetical protein